MEWVANATPRPLYALKTTPQPIVEEAVWAGVEKNSLSPPGFEPSSPLRVTVSTSVALDSMVFHSRRVKGKYHLRVRQPRSSATIITHNPTVLSIVRQTARNLTSLTRATSYVTRHTSTVSVGPRISKHMYNFVYE